MSDPLSAHAVDALARDHPLSDHRPVTVGAPWDSDARAIVEYPHHVITAIVAGTDDAARIMIEWWSTTRTLATLYLRDEQRPGWDPIGVRRSMPVHDVADAAVAASVLAREVWPAGTSVDNMEVTHARSTRFRAVRG